MSLAMAEILSRWANWALVASLVAGVLATYAITISSDVKEKALRLELAQAGAVAENAKRDAALANEKAAASELALAKFKAPRSLRVDQQSRIINKITPYVHQRYFGLLSSAAFDARPLFDDLIQALSAAAWIRLDPPGIKSGNPPVGISIDAPEGLTVEIAPVAPTSTTLAAKVLSDALNAEGIASRVEINTALENRSSDLAIEIGLKPAH